MFSDASVASVKKVEGTANAGFAAFRKGAARKPKPADTDDTDREAAEKLDVGQRVVTQRGQSATIRFIGPVAPLPKGFWVGIELDEAAGKNDGLVKGVRLFTCEANHGAVCRPSTVQKAQEDTAEDEI
eukprot:CAMPEP_0185770056 /NCGR_PEP_ID=MMETSP1174-20130828/57283_1 /TAXON_ID=35687 /ORGANISM="Dictyocha speculum, Strain CCMP1381" /LENGTH=127 /DNA_ID=CAMNT_0028455351 /DNA_START=19 /DNA_END=402 /DNA_ORIENTATION=-